MPDALTGAPSAAVADSAPRSTATEIAVSVRALHKSFRLPHEKYSTVKERLLHPLAHRTYDVLPALHDISFEVERGQAFGVVGRNGSGKSTLMKCLSRIYRADAGEVEVHGRLAPFIELGVGFNPELTARDNAIANAIMLGLRPAEAAARFDEIIAFAELEEFVDLKLKNFSSGMKMRLAFAVTIQVDADVLLFDEVLTVGDESFQAKCLERFEVLKAEGRTLALVTHDMSAVEDFCDRALLLDHGRLVEVGEPAAIAQLYHEVNQRPPQHGAVVERRRWHSRATGPARSPGARRTPTTVGDDMRRLATLTRTLALAEFKVKYLDATLSYLWVLLGPLAFFAILYFVFSGIAQFDEGVAHYPVYLLSSLVLWMFFADATSRAVTCLVAHESLLRQVPFPHVALPLSIVARALFDLGMSCLAVLAFVLASGIGPRLSWLQVVPLVAMLAILAAGLAMLLSALYVRFRDVDHVWALVRQLLFYASPIFYAATQVPDPLKPVLLANPLSALFTQVRHAVIDPAAPTAIAAYGGVLGAIVPVAIVVVTFALGLWVFRRESPIAAENV